MNPRMPRALFDSLRGCILYLGGLTASNQHQAVKALFSSSSTCASRLLGRLPRKCGMWVVAPSLLQLHWQQVQTSYYGSQVTPHEGNENQNDEPKRRCRRDNPNLSSIAHLSRTHPLQAHVAEYMARAKFPLVPPIVISPQFACQEHPAT